MWQLVFKSLVSGVIVMAASELAKRSQTFGALIASLPLVSILAMIWLWHDTHDTARLAGYASATFWLVLPSLPMFLILPLLLRYQVGFYCALAICCLLTAGLYLLMLRMLGIFGISF